MVTIAEDYRRKYLTILQNLYSGDKTLIGMAQRAQAKFEEGEQDAFDAFQYDVGAHFIELKEELDQGLEDLGDIFSDPDSRKWDDGDWVEFFGAIQGHKFQEIYELMGLDKPNIHLIWKELENRLDLP